MFIGPPLPLPGDFPLRRLLALTQPYRSVGAWVRGWVSRARIRGMPRWAPSRVLASGDLGLLLDRCERVALRQGDQAVVLETETIIEWRALQVATALPCLPGIERLGELFPGLRIHPTSILVPLHTRSPEDVLSCCIAEGIPVAGSRIVYDGYDGKDGREGEDRKDK